MSKDNFNTAMKGNYCLLLPVVRIVIIVSLSGSRHRYQFMETGHRYQFMETGHRYQYMETGHRYQYMETGHRYQFNYSGPSCFSQLY